MPLRDPRRTALLLAAAGTSAALQKEASGAASGADADVTAAGSQHTHEPEIAAGSQRPPQETELSHRQSAALLSAWLEGDLWRQCPAGGAHALMFRRLLKRLAARYLVLERRRNHALDPVANFHLRNGAQLWRLNWGADAGERCARQSFGMMVNYRYDLALVHSRNQAYVVKHRIDASPEVQELLLP